MSELNGQSLPPPQDGQLLLPHKTKAGKYTGEILLRTRPKTYRKVVELLSQGQSSVSIANACRVSRDTIRAIVERESADISQRKNELINMLSDVAHIGTGRVADTIGRAKVRDAIIGTGVAVDKLLALSGQAPVAVGVVVMPSEAERADMRAMDARLDEIARRLALATSKVIELPQGE